MKTRIISAIIMLPLLLLVYIRGPLLWALAFLIGIIGVIEFFRGFEAIGVKPSKTIAIISSMGLYATIIWATQMYMYSLWLIGTVVLSLLILFNEEAKLEDAMATLIGILYVPFFASHIVLLDMTNKSAMVFVAILVALGTDIFAYFIGISLGKHKLCPRISPKKTIEGALGGILGSVLLCTGFSFLIFAESVFHFIIIGIVGSVFAQLGDLTASLFKRKMGIKDYGDLIPGHGGILDRFDSLLFTAIFVYYYVILIMH